MAATALSWVFGLHRQASIGDCPGSHLGGFLCKPNRSLQQRNRNQTRKIRWLQENISVACCWVLTTLLGLPFMSGSTFTAVCSLLRLPVQQEKKQRLLGILLQDGKSS